MSAHQIHAGPASALLAGIFVACLEGRPLSALEREWFVLGVLHAARAGVSLDEGLGLSRAGQRGLRTSLLQARRDWLLAKAAAALTTCGQVSLWELAGRLESEVRRVRPLASGRRALRSVPREWSLARRAIWSAFALGVGVPATREALFAALKRTPAYSFKPSAAIVLAGYL